MARLFVEHLRHGAAEVRQALAILASADRDGADVRTRCIDGGVNIGAHGG
jgi:hypothetical protein